MPPRIRNLASRMSMMTPPEVSPIFTNAKVRGELPTSGCMTGLASYAPCASSVSVSKASAVHSSKVRIATASHCG